MFCLLFCPKRRQKMTSSVFTLWTADPCPDRAFNIDAASQVEAAGDVLAWLLEANGWLLPTVWGSDDLFPRVLGAVRSVHMALTLIRYRGWRDRARQRGSGHCHTAASLVFSRLSWEFSRVWRRPSAESSSRETLPFFFFFCLHAFLMLLFPFWARQHVGFSSRSHFTYCIKEWEPVFKIQTADCSKTFLNFSNLAKRF